MCSLRALILWLFKLLHSKIVRITFRRYSEKYRYLSEFSLGATVFRQHLIEEDKNFEEMNRGMFFQKSAKLDDVQDPEVNFRNIYSTLNIKIVCTSLSDRVTSKLIEVKLN